MIYSLHRFKLLPKDSQLAQLDKQGIALDLAYVTNGTEGVLFAYNDFYVELVAERYSGEILTVKCFKSIKKLEPYLNQVDIDEITILLACQ